MNSKISLLTSAVLLATSSFVFAAPAVDTTDIEIKVTKDSYVNFFGSLAGNTTETLTLAEVDNTTTTLGDLGFNSNTTGTCTVSFSSPINDYKLVHDTDPLLNLGDYTITYRGVSNSAASSGNVFIAPTCNEPLNDMTITSPALPAVVIAGTYSDTVTVTVTTQ